MAAAEVSVCTDPDSHWRWRIDCCRVPLLACPAVQFKHTGRTGWDHYGLTLNAYCWASQQWHPTSGSRDRFSPCDRIDRQQAVGLVRRTLLSEDQCFRQFRTESDIGRQLVRRSEPVAHEVSRTSQSVSGASPANRFSVSAPSKMRLPAPALRAGLTPCRQVSRIQRVRAGIRTDGPGVCRRSACLLRQPGSLI